MVPEPSTTTVTDAPADGGGTSTLVNALLGGVVGVVLAVLPFSPVLGGGVAGYLEADDARNWVAAGAIAGVVMLVPLFFVMMFALFVLGIGMYGSTLALGMVTVFVFLFGAAYTVGLSLLGAYLGTVLVDEV
ncbi:MAG: DUF5518 domain-containing protein [Halobacteriaceae archaeon]